MSKRWFLIVTRNPWLWNTLHFSERISTVHTSRWIQRTGSLPLHIDLHALGGNSDPSLALIDHLHNFFQLITPHSKGWISLSIACAPPSLIPFISTHLHSMLDLPQLETLELQFLPPQPFSSLPTTIFPLLIHQNLPRLSAFHFKDLVLPMPINLLTGLSTLTHLGCGHGTHLTVTWHTLRDILRSFTNLQSLSFEDEVVSEEADDWFGAARQAKPTLLNSLVALSFTNLPSLHATSFIEHFTTPHLIQLFIHLPSNPRTLQAEHTILFDVLQYTILPQIQDLRLSAFALEPSTIAEFFNNIPQLRSLELDFNPHHLDKSWFAALAEQDTLFPQLPQLYKLTVIGLPSVLPIQEFVYIRLKNNMALSTLLISLAIPSSIPGKGSQVWLKDNVSHVVFAQVPALMPYSHQTNCTSTLGHFSFNPHT